jgi:flagellar export protein FliJ
VKRFEFKLARLARVRKIEEEQARVAWQAAETLARRADESVRAAERDVIEATEALRAAQSSAQLEPLAILNIDDAIARLGQRVGVMRAEAERCHLEAATKRAPWQTLRTELEGLTRLEEKARTNHRIEHERAEALEMDQLASERSARGGSNAMRGPAPRSTPELWRPDASSR